MALPSISIIMSIKKLLSCFAMFVLTACSEAKFGVANLPQYTYNGQIIKNIAYGNHKRQTLDIYIPDRFEKPLPVIVFFHGGRWTFGSKDQYKFVGITLSKLGYVVVLPNTRLYPEVKHPTFVEDGAKAVAWVHSNITNHDGNNKLFLSGHSSGAHIAALLTANETFLQHYDLNPNSLITAFAGLSGPYDFEPEEDDLKDMFGPPDNYPNMQVPTFIDGDEPPMLLLHTADDDVVHTRNIDLLKQKIEAKGGHVEVKLYPKGDHAASVASLSWVNATGLTVAKDMDDFFKKINASKTAHHE